MRFRLGGVRKGVVDFVGKNEWLSQGMWRF